MNWNLLDRVRRNSTPLEVDLIDHYAANKISRRDFIRRGTILGLGMTSMSAVIAACGGDTATTTTAGGVATTQGGGTPQAGGLFRMGTQTPASALDPILMQDLGTYGLIAMSFEYLLALADDGGLAPGLAESWSANDDATIWTFNLRQGVKWHDGSDFTSADVAATMDRIAEGNIGGLTAGGFLAAGAVDASDPAVAVVQLNKPNGNLPALLSLYNAQTPITPVNYEIGTTLDAVKNGTGPFKLVDFDASTGATYEKNPDWWGGNPSLDTVEFQFFDDLATNISAAVSGAVDGVIQFQVIGGDALLNDSNFVVLETPTANHREIWMRVDQGQFTDKRVRQALAYTFDRPKMVEVLYKGKAVVANDHVVAPFFEGFDASQEQRPRDIEMAKQLLADAGLPDGFSATLNHADFQEIPQLAQLIQAGAAEAGINLTLAGESLDTFYGNAWCPGEPASPPCSGATELGIVDYGHRPTPDVYFNNALTSNAIWNSSQYASSEFDGLVDEYSAAADVSAKTTALGKIQRLLTDEVPVGLAYFYNYLSAHSKDFTGIQVSALGHPYLGKASKVG